MSTTDELHMTATVRATVYRMAQSILLGALEGDTDVTGCALVVASDLEPSGLRFLATVPRIATYDLDETTRAVFCRASDVASHVRARGWTETADVFEAEPEPMQLRSLVLLPGLLAYDRTKLHMAAGGQA